ncbi:MAG: helix-hairpin-helix domain-containing protein, partial [Phaeodactylibacter sp.]|nr:helix-hairpin-helix domain-containing protein [Phaeodactylibacter sp.]
MATDPTSTNRLLTFLNKLKTADALLEKLDRIHAPTAPATNGAKDYGLGETIAQRIFEYKAQLPGRRFSKLDQLEDIKGFGPDKLQELSKKVCIPAALAFKNSMYAHLIAENWVLENYSFHLIAAEFMETVENESIFTEFVCDKLEDISLQKFNNHKAAMLAAQLLKCCYLES